jgi:hypothetical protein
MATTPRIPAQRGRRQARPAAPLGSLTQRDHRSGATCAVCGSAHVTRLRMSLTDGTPVDFTSCHHCEHRSWAHVGGGELAVAAVLEHARKQ